jgi:hypothetical protein
MVRLFPEGRRDMSFTCSRDGRVTYWQQQRDNSKLVMIENLHR